MVDPMASQAQKMSICTYTMRLGLWLLIGWMQLGVGGLLCVVPSSVHMFVNYFTHTCVNFNLSNLMNLAPGSSKTPLPPWTSCSQSSST